MALQHFSDGYYSLDMQVQRYSDGPVIDSALHDYINREVYTQTDVPVTFKLSMDRGTYFSVDAENGVPPSVLALPNPWVETLDVSDNGRSQKIFVLKPDHAYSMYQSGILGDDI